MTDTFHIKQNDTSPAIEYQLQYEDSDGVLQNRDITGYQSVEFHLVDANGSVKVNDDDAGNVSVTEAVTGKVKYDWQTGDTDTSGFFEAEWQVTYSDGTIESFPNDDAGAPVEIVPEIA